MVCLDDISNGKSIDWSKCPSFGTVDQMTEWFIKELSSTYKASNVCKWPRCSCDYVDDDYYGMTVVCEADNNW